MFVMLNQFSRTELILGKEAMEKLFDSHVAVFGIGGVGSYTVEALVRTGVGAIDIFDDDKVCETNINRQLFATRKTIGKYKVDVAEERLKVVYSKEEPITPKTTENLCDEDSCICNQDEKASTRRQIPGSNAFVPPVVGLIIAGEVIKDLIGNV